jgi:hypothetical protein
VLSVKNWFSFFMAFKIKSCQLREISLKNTLKCLHSTLVRYSTHWYGWKVYLHFSEMSKKNTENSWNIPLTLSFYVNELSASAHTTSFQLVLLVNLWWIIKIFSNSNVVWFEAMLIVSHATKFLTNNNIIFPSRISRWKRSGWKIWILKEKNFSFKIY